MEGKKFFLNRRSDMSASGSPLNPEAIDASGDNRNDNRNDHSLLTRLLTRQCQHHHSPITQDKSRDRMMGGERLQNETGCSFAVIP